MKKLIVISLAIMANHCLGGSGDRASQIAAGMLSESDRKWSDIETLIDQSSEADLAGVNWRDLASTKLNSSFSAYRLMHALVWGVNKNNFKDYETLVRIVTWHRASSVRHGSCFSVAPDKYDTILRGDIDVGGKIVVSLSLASKLSSDGISMPGIADAKFVIVEASAISFSARGQRRWGFVDKRKPHPFSGSLEQR